MHSVHLCSVIIPTFVATLSMMSYTSLCWLSLDTSFVTVWLELYRDKFVSTILFKRLLLAYRHSLHSLLNDCCSKYNSQGSMKSSWCVYRQILLKLVKLVISCAEFSYFNFPPRTHVYTATFPRISWAMLVLVLRYFSINSSTQAKTHNVL